MAGDAREGGRLKPSGRQLARGGAARGPLPMTVPVATHPICPSHRHAPLGGAEEVNTRVSNAHARLRSAANAKQARRHESKRRGWPSGLADRLEFDFDVD